MRIVSIHIDEFGVLENRDFSFAAGMNILEGKNESGKSTLLAFIKFMLYGAPGRTAGEIFPERTRRLNWRTGRAAGSMTVFIEADQREYRIERSLARTVSGSAESSRESFVESLQIIDLTDGSPLPRGTQPGEHFLGGPASVFESTAFVRQLGCTGIDGPEVSEALENLLTSANESNNTARALSRLDAARKSLLHKNGRGGEIYSLQNDRAVIAERLARAKAAGSERIAAQTHLDALIKSGAETGEKLTQISALYAAREASTLLFRFESLHALESKTDALRTELSALYAAEGAGDFFPSRTYAAQLRDVERRIASAETEYARIETELARMRYEQPCSRTQAAQAAEIRTAGGVDALTGHYAELAHTAKSMRTLAILLFVLGALFLIGGAVLWYLMPTVAGYLPMLLSLPMLAGGVAALSASRRRRTERDALCRKYGMSGDAGEVAFADWLNACFGAEEQIKGYEEVLAQIEDELNARQTALDTLRGEAADALEKWGITVRDGGLNETLSTAIPRAERAADTADNLMRDLDKYSITMQNIRTELEDHDEEVLRSRVAAVDVDPAGLNITALHREHDSLVQAVNEIEHQRIETEKRLIALDATAEDPIHLAAQLEAIDRRIAELTARHDAIQLAAASLADAAESMRRGIIPRLRTRAGELLSSITNGRYAGIGLGHGLSMTVETADATRPVELLSSGTGDAAYLALRLSLLELLFPNERPPILLDESLAQLDNTRAAALLAMLEKKTREGAQCLIFTCHPREAQMVEAEHILLG